MKIIVDISEDAYNYIKANGARIPYHRLTDAIKNGTPLPKGHGDLIDADELKKEYPHDEDWDYPVNTNSYVVESIDNSHTIVEADRSDEV